MKSRIKQYLAFLLLVWQMLSVDAVSQQISSSAPPSNLIRDFSVEHFSIEQGFANEGVEAMLQDHFGYLWIVTDRAIYRYDGLAFKRYVHDPQDSTSLFAPPYHVVHEDRKGTLWIGGAGGLQRYDGEHNAFVRYAADAKGDAQRSSQGGTKAVLKNIRSICNDPESSNLWLGVGENACVFQPESGKVIHRYAVPRSSGGVDARHVRSLVVDLQKRVWAIRRDDNILALFDRQAQGFRPAILLPAVISGAMIVHGDSLWVSCADGVALCSAQEKRLLAIYPTSNNPLALSPVRTALSKFSAQSDRVTVYNLHRDTDGRIWCATSDGLAVIYPARGFIQNFRHNPLDSRTLSTNETFVVFQDRSGVIWIGEGVYGLHKYAPLRHKFQLYRHNPFDVRTISNNFIRCIIEDSKGNLWVATQFGGLNMLNRQTGGWKRYRHNPTEAQSITSDNVWALHEDKNGVLWVGVRSGSLCTIDLKHPERGFTRRTFMDNRFYAQYFYEDRLGYLWIGTFTNEPALYRLSPDRKTIEAMHKTHAMPSYCKDIQSIYEDRTSSVWIGSVNGLFRYDRQTHTFREYLHTASDTLSVADNFITSITETANGELWITTKGGGLCRYNRAQDNFTRLTTSDGLPHNNCYALLEDEMGNYWMSTDDGICQYTPRTKSFRRFTASDGLQGKEFNRFAYFKSKSGEMFFGGVEGINSFFSSETRINTIPPQPAIQEIRSLSGLVLMGNATLARARTIEVLPQHNSIVIDLAALEFTAPERNLYSWRMEGVEDEWTKPGTAHQALYANLAPGNYTFRAKVASGDSIWSDQEGQLSVVVLPAWWQTWWFRVAVLLGLGGIILAVSKWRVRQIEARTRHLERIIAIRTRELRESNEALNSNNAQLTALNMEMQEIMGIVSHDLKNPIASVMGLVDLLRQPSNFGITPEVYQQILDQIFASGHRMLHLLRNLLDTNALESGHMTITLVPVSLDTILRLIVEEYRPRAAAKDIVLHYAQPESNLALADEVMIHQVLDNLVSNAVKYSPLGKNVWISLENAVDTEKHPTVRVAVRDEGPGISEKDKQKLFGRFMRLSARPTNGEDSTGLGLSIVKKMVGMMNGRVWCESELGNGGTFSVELPAYDEASVVSEPKQNLFA